MVKNGPKSALENSYFGEVSTQEGLNILFAVKNIKESKNGHLDDLNPQIRGLQPLPYWRGIILGFS